MLQIIKEKKSKKVPHLALTHEAQGGPANGRKASLIMKSDSELTEDQKALVEALLKSQDPTEVEKATYQALSLKLDKAVRAREEKTDRWGWAYVRDFDNKTVIYSNSRGVFAVGYTVEGGDVVLSDTETSVNEMISWEDSSGKVIVTQSDSISSDVSGLVIKSFSTEKEDIEKISEIFKSKYEEGKQMTELEKALADITELRTQLEKANADKETAEKALQAIKEAEAVAKSAKRLEVLKAVVAEDKLEALHKSLEVLDDAGFDGVVEQLTAVKKAAEEASGMFVQVSKAKAEAPEQKTEMETLAGILKELDK